MYDSLRAKDIGTSSSLLFLCERVQHFLHAPYQKGPSPRGHPVDEKPMKLVEQDICAIHVMPRISSVGGVAVCLQVAISSITSKDGVSIALGTLGR